MQSNLRQPESFRIHPYPTYRCRATARVSHCEVEVIFVPAESAPSPPVSAAVVVAAATGNGGQKLVGSAPRPPDQRTQGIFQRPPVSPAVSAGPPRSEAGCANCGASACAVSDSEGDQPPPLAASYAGGWSTATQKGCTCLSKICAAR